MSTRKLYKVARLMAAMVIVTGAVGLMKASEARAEHVRSILEKASSLGYARITSLGAGPSAEAVDFTDLSDFSSNHRSFSIQVENEDATEANVLLFQLVTSGSVTASELTTPGTDGTETTVYRLRGGKTLSIDAQAVGVILQSGDHTNLVDANVTWNY